MSPATRRRAAIAACLLSLSLLSGCSLLIIGGLAAGAGAGTAIFFKGRLEDSLEASLAKSRTATLAALREMNLPVLSDKSHPNMARIESETVDKRRVSIELQATASKCTAVIIRVGMMGDETFSKELLSRMRAKL
jgi:hypothetical protein